MIGDGPERHNAELLCKNLHLSEHVRFLGKQDAIEELLAISDLFLMPSESESFGLAALEAMACEVPVISSDAGGIPEMNINGKTGFTLPIGNIEDMAEKSLILLKDEQLLREFRANAYQNARLFDIEHIVPMYENLYIEIISKSKSELSCAIK
jgi:N-acetyl-alpha-D-glucosaminyl L-malate synthase BshA